ncbi:MAG TPA: UDP-glucose 4-epimerase GalE [Humidesulfovibrio sp.]|uniref:UDP-glucose 4-epimerase GalE n=1 Tax=Humidesulfovibrio sp. TaxID=2910988 RepID=UPI002D1BCBCC|nr:UDP-glucose 4-epimerase GalE [Humidesulfovibrio sp.]HWR04295.1 UDP-glucose 4-epimerase GalE [Humidesulfovibrio sp.]
MSTILVSGGAGYIGSHTVKRLHEQGFTPVVLDNLSTGHSDFLRWGSFVLGDVGSAETLDAVFSAQRVDAVIHFASSICVGESATDPLTYYANNVANTIALLQAMRRNAVPLFVFSSSCAVYGPPFDGLLREDHPVGPISPYARTKLMVELILEDCARAFGLKYACMRYFNAAGADPGAQVGERHLPETHLIPLVLQVALGQRPEVKLLGDDYSTPDGTCIRDYIHVQDLAEAHVLALRYLEAGGRSGAVNLGNGTGYSVREVLDAAASVTGKAIPYSVVPRRPGDSPRLVGDASKARDVLGWKPEYPDIREILATAWQWHKADYGSH